MSDAKKKAPKKAKVDNKTAPVDPALYDFIKAPMITEKATMASEHNQVMFRVPLKATKPQIKKAVESLFSVKVERVTTLNVLGKSKRTARGLGKRNDWKKAVISLQPGQDLDFSSSAE